MPQKSVTIALAATIVAVVSIGIAFSLYESLAEAKSEIHELEKQNANLLNLQGHSMPEIVRSPTPVPAKMPDHRTTREQEQSSKVSALPADKSTHVFGAPDVDPQTVRRNVQKGYGALVDGLNLGPEIKAKIKDLLVERTLSAADAREMALKVKDAPNDFLFSAVSEATNVVDLQIKGIVDDGSYEIIKQALDASLFFSQLSNGPAIDAAFYGHAWSSEQVAKIATLYAQQYDARRNPNAREMLNGPRNPETGLTPAQTVILSKAASVLDDNQMGLLRQELSGKRD